MKVAVSLSDEALIGRYLKGDHNALESLISRHQKKVYTYILMLVRNKNEADDIFQDTFIKVINTLRSGSYNEEGKFIQWIMRIAHNLAIDSYRNNKRIPITDGGDDFDIFDTIGLQDPCIEEQMIVTQIHKDVRSLIEYLPEDQKEVLYMRMYRDMSFKEIAEATNVSINTALGRMRYALINLRKMVNENKMVLTV
ncbi:MAG: sigma-70 family RNA polymerase sigma factor [Bacteroidales bacterium]|jgi:RNA polymerase sigma-70 factor (ECF subfamily)|nr:sigma-70 family RNA polymerase sigma factor [Bacteroidales bacterium]